MTSRPGGRFAARLRQRESASPGSPAPAVTSTPDDPAATTGMVSSRADDSARTSAAGWPPPAGSASSTELAAVAALLDRARRDRPTPTTSTTPTEEPGQTPHRPTGRTLVPVRGHDPEAAARDSAAHRAEQAAAQAERAAQLAQAHARSVQPPVTIGEIHVHEAGPERAPADPLALLAPYAAGLTARRPAGPGAR
ncbi:hypothetical protein ABZV93_08085 [Actinopolymorpha sp. NPDC004070]|uniref:hypothetical protein n=1 Tax=Actinopolymorpha sp. NPDC004070 TaxID=3154548 RepID=UPI0033A4D3F1